MSVTPAKLRQLHRLLRQIGDLKSRLEQGPRRLARSKAVVAQHEERVVEAKKRCTRLATPSMSNRHSCNSGKLGLFSSKDAFPVAPATRNINS